MRHRLMIVLGILGVFIFGVSFLQTCSDANLRPILVYLALGILSLLALYLIAVPNLQLHLLGRMSTQLAIVPTLEAASKLRQLTLVGMNNVRGKSANGHFGALMRNIGPNNDDKE